MTESLAPESRRPEKGVGEICIFLLRYAAKRWGGLSLVLVTMCVGIGLDLLKPWPMKVLVDNVLGGKPMSPMMMSFIEALPGPVSRDALLGWSIGGTVILFLLGWGLAFVSAYVSVGFGQRMVYDLAADLFAHLQRLSLGFHSRKGVGDSIRRVTTDCGCVSTIVKDAFLPVLTSIITLGAMFTIMWRLDSWLTLLSLAVVPLMILAFALYARPMLERGYQQQEIEGQIYNIIDQTLTSIPAIQAFTREEYEDRRFRATARKVLDAALSTTSIQMQFRLLVGLATSLGTAGILWIGARQVLDGHLTLGSILVFLSYLSSLYAPLESLMYTSSTVQSAAGSAQRVIEILETERDVIDRPDAPALVVSGGHLRVDSVTLGFTPGVPFLRDVSLEALPGQTIAIVGETGAGKSTLVGLVPRFLDPWSGQVLIDGQDLRDVSLRSLRGQISLVLQEPFLFPSSIAANIAYGRPDASSDQITAAAKAANAHRFIERLPHGYETVIGERGATLSGGERQRISIARALLKDAPILILDEPTSALDVETESLLLEALDRLMKGRTTLIIAHRLSTIRNASAIAVMEAGRIAEWGSHEELLAKGSLYAQLHRLQFGRSPAPGSGPAETTPAEAPLL